MKLVYNGWGWGAECNGTILQRIEPSVELHRGIWGIYACKLMPPSYLLTVYLA